MTASLPPPGFFSEPYLYIYQARNILAEVPMAVGAIMLLTAIGTWMVFRLFHKRALDQIPILERQLSVLKDHLTAKNEEIAKLKEQQTHTAPSPLKFSRSVTRDTHSFSALTRGAFSPSITRHHDRERPYS